MSEDLTECPSCKYGKALTHWSSDDVVNWVACPRCRKYFEHGKEIPPEENDPNEPQFWDKVEEDTGFKKEMRCEDGKRGIGQGVRERANRKPKA